jgi:hypothetical protein
MSVLKVIELLAIQLLVGKMQHKSDYQSFKIEERKVGLR